MFTILKLLVFSLLTYNSDSFLTPYGKNVRPNTKIYNSKSTNDIDFMYAKEYYNFLKEYNIINVFGSDDKSTDKTKKYVKVCKKRLENYKIFERNFIKISDFNKKNSFTLGLNQFADTSNFDFGDLMKNPIEKNDIYKNDFKGLYQMVTSPRDYIEKYNNISDSFIWDDKIIPNVKNQGRCGSCWAFSTTGSIEGLMRINKYCVDRLSEQELVDCSTENYGCGGGLMDLAMDYCIENDGLTSNRDYPYTARDGKCALKCDTDCNDKGCDHDCSNKDCDHDTKKLTDIKKIKGSKFKDYKYVIPRSVLDIKASLKNSPISIALDASHFAFRFYKDGVIDVPPTNSDQLNHAVLLTGYGKDVNGTYWIIQNSWGETWGDNGFCKIRAKNGDGVLLCQLYGVYPHY